MINNLKYLLDTHRSLGLNGINLRVLRMLVEVLRELLFIFYQQS